MAPKAQKSVPSKNSHKEFKEKFSNWAIHSDRQVILSDFSDTMVSRLFRSRGWEFLCERPVTYPSMFVKEFYSNIYNVDTSVPRFFTQFRCTCIVVTAELRALSRDVSTSRFCERSMSQGHKLSFVTHDFAKDPQISNMVMTFILTPSCHYNTITKPRACFLYSQLKGLSIDFPSCMILSILDTFHDNASHDKLIFSSFIKHILIHASVSIPSSFHFSIMGAIGKESIVRSFPSWSLRPSIHELILLLLSGRKQSFVLQRMLPILTVPLPHLLHLLLPLLEQTLPYLPSQISSSSFVMPLERLKILRLLMVIVLTRSLMR